MVDAPVLSDSQEMGKTLLIRGWKCSTRGVLVHIV